MFWFPVRHCDYVGHSLLTAFYVDANNYDNHTSQTKILEIMHEIFGVVLPACITDIIHCFFFLVLFFLQLIGYRMRLNIYSYTCRINGRINRRI